MDDPKSEYLAGGLWKAECWWHFLEGCLPPSDCHSLRWTIRYRKSHFRCPCPRLCHVSSLHGLVWGKSFAGGTLIQGRRENVVSKHRKWIRCHLEKMQLRVSAGINWWHFLVVKRTIPDCYRSWRSGPQNSKNVYSKNNFTACLRIQVMKRA